MSEAATTGKSATAGQRTYTRQELQDQLISIIRSELPDKSVELGMDTRTDQIDIDSLAIIQTVFKVEEEFGITVPIASDAQFETVGELVGKLIECFPPGRITG